MIGRGSRNSGSPVEGFNGHSFRSRQRTIRNSTTPRNMLRPPNTWSSESMFVPELLNAAWVIICGMLDKC